MKSLHFAGLAAAFGALLTATLGCSEQEVVTQLRSLSASEDAVFVCRDAAGNGHPSSDCPDRDTTDDSDPTRQVSMFALVSQTVTDEVAVVNVTAGGVVDADPSTPGYGFLRVGGRPVAMAATPGGTVTFVATADVGRNALFALPTQCLGAPGEKEPRRDLTTWAGCRLPAVPGEMAMLVEPFGTDSGDCSRAEYADDEPGSGNECSVNLKADGGPKGRRKLVISFPDLGQIGVVDAQSVLNSPAGAAEFPDCAVALLPLKAEVPAGVSPVLPADLQTECKDVEPPPTAPVPVGRSPQPAGFAQAEDKLYIADRSAPVIHVIDTHDACNLNELPSLLPMSLREPDRIVTTRRLAVSPLTPGGQRYVYAIDSEDQPVASVMVFDVSAGSTNLTPLVRSGSPELPGEKPDRLALDASARDVAFAYRDIPYVDPATGVGQFGDRCNPDPAADPTTPGALARSSTDLTLGARPGLLRGLFGFILQTNGLIAVVDVDDFDAACRRPINTGESFRGCEADAEQPKSFTRKLSSSETTPQDENAHLYVTNEVSCRVVEPHRFRSARPVLNSTSISAGRAPSLRSFPQLTLPASAPSADNRERPRLLAVPYGDGEAGVATVDVGATTYATNAEAGQLLAMNPNDRDSELLQTQNSLILPPLEPRSYPTEDRVTLTYEGSYAGLHTSGTWGDSKDGITLIDDSWPFCVSGVYDEATMTEYGASELGLSEADAEAFGKTHGDLLEITNDFPAEDDSYWAYAATTRKHCDELFSAADDDTLKDTRDLRIVSAFANKLLLEPLSTDVTLEDFKQCFPEALKYRLRAHKHWVLLHNDNDFRHDIVASGSDSACKRSCNPLRKWSKGRVFEISSRAEHCRSTMDAGDPLDLRVGCAAPGEVACVYDQLDAQGNGRPVPSDDPAARCIFNGLNERFALYRGRMESFRDASFTWVTTGGFAPLVLSLKAVSSSVSPQSLQYLGATEQLAVVDGATLGLTLFSLDTFGVVKPSPFY